MYKKEMKLLCIILIYLKIKCTSGFWDIGTTTTGFHRTDVLQRTSFFRWQRCEFEMMKFWMPHFDWDDLNHRRKLCVVAGISIDFLPLSTATILNRRMLLTAANYIDPWMTRQHDLRIWCLGRAGQFNTPYRYRVYRVWRIRPRSANAEHQHGVRGEHCPRHDVALIISWDQMYIYYRYPHRFMYAYRSTLTGPRDRLSQHMYFAGSGYEYLQHIYENYKIFYGKVKRSHVVDCSIYLPKWWGKFICIKNLKALPGLQNGGGLFSNDKLVAVGCFEIRYNEDRLFVFTDLRYYVRWIHKYANIRPGQYYEYAYAQWSIALGVFYDGNGNYPYIPAWQIRGDLFPLG